MKQHFTDAKFLTFDVPFEAVAASVFHEESLTGFHTYSSNLQKVAPHCVLLPFTAIQLT